MKVDENMKRAHARDAINTQKFFFRKHIAPPAEDTDSPIGDGSVGDGSVGDGSVESCGKKCDLLVRPLHYLLTYLLSSS